MRFLNSTLFFLVSLLVFSTYAYAERRDRVTVEIIPTTATYTEVVEDGVTVYQRSDVFNKGDSMGFSGTSACQVIDISKMAIDGYFTYQFKMLSGTSDMPVSGTSISVHWRGSNIDSEAAWLQATKNTIISGIDALTGISNVGYDVNDITGVTPFKYIRYEFESGISKEFGGAGNLIPVGVLHIR